jgi:glycerophosphoryl diester phosphodiesterase
VRRKLLYVPVILLAITVAIFSMAALFARPAPDHPYFAAGRPGLQVIAHRGGAGLRPENTLAAFSHAAQIGADVLEMDVQPTADGAIVCIHDATVDRTTDGRGRVESFTLSELQRLDAGYHWSGDGGRSHPFRGAGVRVPALGEVLARFPQMRMIVEMKRGGPGLAQPLCQLIRRFGRTQRTLVASFNDDAMAAFRTACPEVATAMSVREARMFHGLYSARLAGVYSPPAPALLMPYRLRGEVLATKALVGAAHRRNLKVNVWEISDEERMGELIGIGVEGIMTDRPDRLLALLRRSAQPSATPAGSGGFGELPASSAR